MAGRKPVQKTPKPPANPPLKGGPPVVKPKSKAR